MVQVSSIVQVPQARIGCGCDKHMTPFDDQFLNERASYGGHARVISSADSRRDFEAQLLVPLPLRMFTVVEPGVEIVCVLDRPF